MPLFQAIGAAIKIGGKALGAIVSKAKAKRAEIKSLRLKKRAGEKELELNSMAVKLGLAKAPERLTTSDISNVSYKRSVKGNEKAMDKALPKVEVQGGNLKVVVPIVAVVVVLIVLFIVKRKR